MYSHLQCDSRSSHFPEAEKAKCTECMLRSSYTFLTSPNGFAHKIAGAPDHKQINFSASPMISTAPELSNLSPCQGVSNKDDV
jgi:hypothetical protein